MRLDGESATLDVGRFAMEYGEARLIGFADFNENGRAFDGARVRFRPGAGVFIDGFITQQAEGRGRSSAEHFGGGDQYFYGLYAQLGPAISKRLDFDLYTLGLSSGPDEAARGANGETVRTDGAAEATLGTRLKHRAGKWDYGVEAGLQIGQRSDVEASVDTFAGQVDAEIGLAPNASSRVFVGGAYATGDDPTTATDESWNQLFPRAHRHIGLMDVIGDRSNIGQGRLGVKLPIAGKLSVQSTGHLFWRPEGIDAAQGFAGGEVDTKFAYTWSKRLVAHALYGVFVPGEALPDDRLAHYLELQLTARF